MKMKLTSRKSFTLTEAVLSVCILAIIWLAAVNTLIVSQYSASYARHKKQAIYATQLEIERLRKYNYALLKTQAGTFNDVHLDTKGTPDNLADDFMATRIITVSDITIGGVVIEQIVVRIQWNEIIFGVKKQMNEYCGAYIANEDQIN